MKQSKRNWQHKKGGTVKASELIAQLYKEIEAHGNLDIYDQNMCLATLEVTTPGEVEDTEAHPNGYIVIGGQ